MWIEARNRRAEREARARIADPGSWDGRDGDAWWVEQDRKRGRR
jgi:hypothetical protein